MKITKPSSKRAVLSAKTAAQLHKIGLIFMAMILAIIFLVTLASYCNFIFHSSQMEMENPDP